MPEDFSSKFKVTKYTRKKKRKQELEKEEVINLFVLMESDPNVELIHGFPEYEGTKGHGEVRTHFHHFLLCIPLCSERFS